MNCTGDKWKASAKCNFCYIVRCNMLLQFILNSLVPSNEFSEISFWIWLKKYQKYCYAFFVSWCNFNAQKKRASRNSCKYFWGCCKVEIHILLMVFSSLNYSFLLSEVKLFRPLNEIRFDKFVDDDDNSRMTLIWTNTNTHLLILIFKTP